MAKLLMTRRGQCWPQYRATPVRYIGGNTEFALKQQPWPAASSIGRSGRGALPLHGGGSARKISTPACLRGIGQPAGGPATIGFQARLKNECALEDLRYC